MVEGLTSENEKRWAQSGSMPILMSVCVGIMLVMCGNDGEVIVDLLTSTDICCS